MDEVGVLILCCLGKKGFRNTAVSRGETRSKMSFARHMYSKITPTVVSKCWEYGCCGTGHFNTMDSCVRLKAADGIQWCSCQTAREKSLGVRWLIATISPPSSSLQFPR